MNTSVHAYFQTSICCLAEIVRNTLLQKEGPQSHPTIQQAREYLDGILIRLVLFAGFYFRCVSYTPPDARAYSPGGRKTDIILDTPTERGQVRPQQSGHHRELA